MRARALSLLERVGEAVSYTIRLDRQLPHQLLNSLTSTHNRRADANLTPSSGQTIDSPSLAKRAATTNLVFATKVLRQGSPPLPPNYLTEDED